MATKPPTSGKSSIKKTHPPKVDHFPSQHRVRVTIAVCCMYGQPFWMSVGIIESNDAVILKGPVIFWLMFDV